MYFYPLPHDLVGLLRYSSSHESSHTDKESGQVHYFKKMVFLSLLCSNLRSNVLQLRSQA